MAWITGRPRGSVETPVIRVADPPLPALALSVIKRVPNSRPYSHVSTLVLHLHLAAFYTFYWSFVILLSFKPARLVSRHWPPMDIFVDEKGVRQPLKVHGLALLALSFQTLGAYSI